MSATAPALVFPPLAAALPAGIDGNQLLQSLPLPVLALDPEDRIRFANAAAAQFLGLAPLGRLLQDIFPRDCPLFTLLEQARTEGASVADREMAVETPALGHRLIAIDVAPLADRDGWLSLTLQERSFTGRLDEALTRRGATRAMGTLAAALAHEVKNPLSGVRGAAQLLEPGLDEAGRSLTHLICEEVDRVVALVDRMEMFADERPIDFGPVNIHRVLDRVRQLAEAGFGRGRRFVCDYDPSLPPVLGNRDLLVQLFLNLVKNAVEATEDGSGVITLSTRFQVGLKLSEPDGGGRYLPLMVTVQDNGSGIPDAMRHCLFDPFASGKPGGKGLGLALVAKLVADHGGLIELASEPRRTQFRVLLPKAAEEEQP